MYVDVKMQVYIERDQAMAGNTLQQPTPCQPDRQISAGHHGRAFLHPAIHPIIAAVTALVLCFHMHGCMFVWMHRWMEDAWMHGCMDSWIHECMNDR